MQLHHTQLTGLLGAVLFSAGLATPIALADEPTESSSIGEPAVQVESTEQGHAKESKADTEAFAQAQGEDMVEVRISLPDGRTIVRFEPAKRTSARRSVPAGLRVSKRLNDGSRISYGAGGVTGGSNSASMKSGSRSGGGGSGGGSGGGGGGSSSAGGSSGGSGGGAMSAGGASRGGAGLMGSGGSEEMNASGSNNSNNSSGSGSVHTIGDPIYNDDGAVGGQRVEFYDAGMGAAVVGNTVYFTGVELVRADQAFEIVDGTRIGSDSAMMVEAYRGSGGDLLSSWNTAASPIKLDFASNTVVDLVMLSLPTDASNPSREQRTWRVRIR